MKRQEFIQNASIMIKVWVVSLGMYFKEKKKVNDVFFRSIMMSSVSLFLLMSSFLFDEEFPRKMKSFWRVVSESRKSMNEQPHRVVRGYILRVSDFLKNIKKILKLIFWNYS